MVDETPLGRTGSTSIGSQRRRTMSASAVVGSPRPRRASTRFARRARSAGFTGLSVT
ncbi:MAG TPA: hypothetical protein HA263_05575 [Methanoregulaceae archaeon]|nr:hypothetical protein [Methanoregulaceae archaeon]